MTVGPGRGGPQPVREVLEAAKHAFDGVTVVDRTRRSTFSDDLPWAGRWRQPLALERGVAVMALLSRAGFLWW
jgi:hypothetical protein